MSKFVVELAYGPLPVEPLNAVAAFRYTMQSGTFTRTTVRKGWQLASQQPDFHPKVVFLAVTEFGVVGYGGPTISPVGLLAFHNKGFPRTPRNLVALVEALHANVKNMTDAELDLGIGDSKGFRRFLSSVMATVAQNQGGNFDVKTDVYKRHLQHAGASIDIFPLVSSLSQAVVMPIDGPAEPVVSIAYFDQLLGVSDTEILEGVGCRASASKMP